MNNSPRLSIILLFALLLVSAGCSASNAGSGAPAEPKLYVKPVTPKAHADDSGADAKTQADARTPREPAYYGGYYDRYGLGSSFDSSRWSQDEINAASFIHAANVYFHFDSSTLTEESKEVLRQKAARLKAFPQLHTLIAGHSDDRGSDDYNMRLGARRAKAVYDYMLSQGVPSTQLDTISYGKRFPVAKGSDEQAWGLNRRDEFMVSKP